MIPPKVRRWAHEIRLHDPLALDFDHSTLFEFETIAKRSPVAAEPECGEATSGIDAACGVHRVGLHIVDVLVRANDPGCDLAGTDADARLQFQLRCFGSGYSVEHARRERGDAAAWSD